MNKKGFTLIELLGIVIIISMLVIIALPLITNSINNYSKKTDKLTLSMIKEAARLYIDDNKNDFVKNSENSYCITISELVDNEYLKESIEYQGADITNTKSLQVTYTNNYNIELVDSDSCIDYRNICKPVTEETKTTGNIPEGNLVPGDEYICEVKPGTKYHFFVLSAENVSKEIITEDTKNKNVGVVNLILDRNINSDGTLATEVIKKNSENSVYNVIEWSSEEDYNNANIDSTVCSDVSCNDEGPITVMKFLNNATKSWSNIPNLNGSHQDPNYGTVSLTGKAKLARYNDIYYTTGCQNMVHNTCPLWMVNYLDSSSGYYENMKNISKMRGYWLLSAHTPINNEAWIIYYMGDVTTSLVPNSNDVGVRPVITLPKNYLVK